MLKRSFKTFVFIIYQMSCFTSGGHRIVTQKSVYLSTKRTSLLAEALFLVFADWSDLYFKPAFQRSREQQLVIESRETEKSGVFYDREL